MGNYKTIGKRGWQMGRLWTIFCLAFSGVALSFHRVLHVGAHDARVHQGLGRDDAHVGLATGLFTLVVVLFRPLSGGMVDQYRPIPFLLWGLVVFAVTMALYGWVNSVAALILLRMIQGRTGRLSPRPLRRLSPTSFPLTAGAREWAGLGWQ